MPGSITAPDVMHVCGRCGRSDETATIRAVVERLEPAALRMALPRVASAGTIGQMREALVELLTRA